MSAVRAESTSGVDLEVAPLRSANQQRLPLGTHSLRARMPAHSNGIHSHQSLRPCTAAARQEAPLRRSQIASCYSTTLPPQRDRRLIACRVAPSSRKLSRIRCSEVSATSPLCPQDSRGTSSPRSHRAAQDSVTQGATCTAPSRNWNSNWNASALCDAQRAGGSHSASQFGGAA